MSARDDMVIMPKAFTTREAFPASLSSITSTWKRGDGVATLAGFVTMPYTSQAMATLA